MTEGAGATVLAARGFRTSCTRLDGRHRGTTFASSTTRGARSTGRSREVVGSSPGMMSGYTRNPIRPRSRVA